VIKTDIIIAGSPTQIPN